MAALYIIFILICLHFYVVVSGTSFTFNGAARNRYVRSNVSIPCLNTQNPCLTFAEYINETDRYFVRDAIFYFSPGTHYLNISLQLKNIDHLSFNGLSADSASTIRFDTNACITIENCSYVEISSIVFNLTGKFTYSLVFEHSLFIHLSNISVLGKKSGSYSAIVSRNSSMNIINSTFTYISSTLGAVMITNSTVILNGNSFLRNSALSGGAIYVTNSTLIFNGTNSFMNNYVKGTSGSYYGIWTEVVRYLSSGGAIFLHNSTLIQDISSVLSFVGNTAEYNSGGAIGSLYSYLWFAGNVLFENNAAYTGGAMEVYHTSICFSSEISFSKNYAIQNGGALHIYHSRVSQSGNKLILLFHHNTAADKGGSVQITNSTLLLDGDIIFHSNSAKVGGALNVEANNYALLQFDGNVQFLDNSARIIGGALNILDAIVQFDGCIYLINNSAALKGGALAITTSNVSFTANDFAAPLHTAAQLMPLLQSGNVSEQDRGTFFYNNSAGTGGAIYSKSSVIQFDTHDTDGFALKDSLLDATDNSVNLSMYFTIFFQNEATNGGCINSIQSIIHFMGSVLFDANRAKIGGAVNVRDSSSQFHGNTLFINNVATTKHGGALEMLQSNVQFKSVIFHDNKARTIGGAIRSLHSDNLQIVGTILFSNNYAQNGGAIHAESTFMNFVGHVCFKNNSADNGGALHTSNSNISFNSNPNFTYLHNTTTFSLNRALYNGGSIRSYDGYLRFAGIITFSNNTARRGGAMKILRISMEICCHVYFLINSARRGGSIHLRCSRILFFDNNIPNSTLFFHNEAAEFEGSIKGRTSVLEFKASVQFLENTALDGGAIALHGTNQVILYPIHTLYFVLNHAKHKGGAIFYEDSLSSIQCSTAFEPKACFISIGSTKLNIVMHHLLVFEENSAGITGTVLYGGQLEKCRMYIGEVGNLNNCNNEANKQSINALDKFKEISMIVEDKTENSTSIITSNAEVIKFCNCYYHYNYCNFSEDNVHKSILFPGQQFNVSVVAIGQDDVPVNSTILSKLKSNGDSYILSPTRHHIDASCNTIAYHLYVPTTNIVVKYKLYHESLCQSLVSGLNIYVQILPCPLGFALPGPHQLQACICSPLLRKFTQNCYINDLSVERSSNNFWVAQMGNNTLILHSSRCPFDYCKNITVNVTLADPDVQCDFNRTGILCGECNEHYSLALGSMHCILCSSGYIVLIVPFAIAGIVLVACIYLLNLTVAIGTLSGLFFYVNIIQANYQAFFPRDMFNFFTVFLAWLNLDLGIETCLYDGMDIYVYSWLQFMFPLYLWLLITIIIVVSRYTQKVAKSLGQNPVTVLATLLLISYSKILSATIAPLSRTSLTYYSYDDMNSSETSYSIIWLYNGNIKFFKEPKHIILGVFALFVLLFLVFPYIFLLLCGQWLQACSNWWIISWINKLKPFMDAYHAPFKKHTRYWTGLLLLSRLGLFMTFAINATGSESVNLLAVSSVAAALLAMKGRVYAQYLNDILESSFILNLCILSVATFYLKGKGERSQLILSSLSVGTTFVTFICLLFFHIYLCFKSTGIYNHYIAPCALKVCPSVFRLFNTRVENNVETDFTELLTGPSVVTSTTVEIREPLLENKV